MGTLEIIYYVFIPICYIAMKMAIIVANHNSYHAALKWNNFSFILSIILSLLPVVNFIVGIIAIAVFAIEANDGDYLENAEKPRFLKWLLKERK